MDGRKWAKVSISKCCLIEFKGAKKKQTQNEHQVIKNGKVKSKCINVYQRENCW